MARKGKNRRQRLADKRQDASGGNPPAVEAAPKVVKLGSLRQLGDGMKAAGMEVTPPSPAGPPKCRGYKVKNRVLTDIPCGMTLKSDQIKLGYCGHHKAQAQSSAEPEVASPASQPEPEPDIKAASAAKEVEAVKADATTNQPAEPSAAPDLDTRIPEERFSWETIDNHGLPVADPNAMTREEALALVEPNGLPQLRLSPDEQMFVAVNETTGAEKQLDCFIVDTRRDGLEIRGKKVRYWSLLLQKDGSPFTLEMWLDNYEKVLRDLQRILNATAWDDLDNVSLPFHHGLPYEVMVYYKAVLLRAGYPAHSDGSLMWAAGMLLRRQYTFQDLLDERQRREEERQALLERRAQEQSAQADRLGDLTDSIRRVTPPAAVRQNGGRTYTRGELKSEIQEFALGLVATLPDDELSYATIVIQTADKFSKADTDLIADALVGLRDALEEAGISVEL